MQRIPLDSTKFKREFAASGELFHLLKMESVLPLANIYFEVTFANCTSFNVEFILQSKQKAKINI